MNSPRPASGHSPPDGAIPPTDAELIRAAHTDPDAFCVLYDRHAEAVHRFVIGRVRDPDAAMDVTAETFCQAWRARERFVDQRSGLAGPWLLGIARNVIATAARARQLQFEVARRMGVELRATVAPGPEWTDGLDDDLERAVADLPPGQRRAVQLRVIDGHSYGDIAADLDCTPTAARIRVSRGLSTLRSALHPATPAPEEK